MRRFYLSKINTAFDPDFGATVTRHTVQTLTPAVEYLGGEIATNEQGQPTQPALLVMISGVDHSAYQDVAGLVPLPDVGIDMGVGAVALETKLATKAAIVALGFDAAETEDVWQNTNGMRAVLNHYGRKNNPAFDADSFDLYQN